MAPLYKLITAVLTVATLGVTASCQSTTTGGTVGADRKQFLLVSSDQLNQMAAKAYNQLQAESAKKGTLNTDTALTKRVRAIATRITPHTSVFRADAPAWKWEVNTITSKELNAFCMPGGKIMFYSGLIQNLKLTDDEIAVVMGHEIAHALREHSREQVSQAMAAQATIGMPVCMDTCRAKSTSRPMSGWPASTMQATPAPLAWLMSAIIAVMSVVGPLAGPDAGGRDAAALLAAGAAPNGVDSFSARTAAAAARNLSMKSGASDRCSWNSVEPPASSSGA
jgi:predicted Zn-dependent protease